jgi:hypothetical protein
MKRFLMALALTTLLAVSAIAGDVSTSGSPAPPPPNGANQTTTSYSPGEVPMVGSVALADASLSALLAVFGLLSVL